jgi:hypothetical protein
LQLARLAGKGEAGRSRTKQGTRQVLKIPANKKLTKTTYIDNDICPEGV